MSVIAGGGPSGCGRITARGVVKVALTVVCAAVAWGGCLSPAARAAPPLSATSLAALPARLAGELVAAHTLAARQRAILDVMRALQISVYTGNGRRIVAGDARGEDDLYLYDFQVQAMAESLGHRETFDASDIAASLQAALGIPTSPQVLEEVLRQGAAVAATEPADPAAFIPRLVRAIGFARGGPRDDIVSNPGTRLDPVQDFLIEASFLGPLLRRASLEQLGGGGSLTGSLRAAPAAHAAGGPCPDLDFDTESEDTQLGDEMLSDWVIDQIKDAIKDSLSEKVQGWIEDVKGVGKETGKKIVETSLVALNALEGALLGFGLAIQPVHNNLKTALGPARASVPYAGKPMKFEFLIYMRDHLPPELLKCLALAGFKIPPFGPVAGVPVNWDVGNLAPYGTFDEGPPTLGALRTHTEHDGIASITFKPRNELFPGLGTRTTVGDGQPVEVLFSPATATDVTLPFHMQALLPFVAPKFDFIDWSLSYFNQAADFIYTSQVTDTAMSPWAGLASYTVTSNAHLSAADPKAGPSGAPLGPKVPVTAQMDEVASGTFVQFSPIICSGPGGTFPGTERDSTTISSGIAGTMVIGDIPGSAGPGLELMETGPSEQVELSTERYGTYCESDPPRFAISQTWFAEHADGTHSGDCSLFCDYDLTGWQHPTSGQYELRYSTEGPALDVGGESKAWTTIELFSAIR